MSDTNDQAGLSGREKIDRYLSLIGPMAMIGALLLLMLILEPARYFRVSNFDIILKDAALYMPMAMAMTCLLYTSPSPRDRQKSRMPSSA